MDSTNHENSHESDRSRRIRYGLVGVLVAGAIGSAGLLAVIGTGSKASTQAFGAPVGPDGGAVDDNADHDHASVLGDDGRFTGPGEVWPPEPKDAENVVALDLSDAPAPTEEVIAEQEAADGADDPAGGAAPPAAGHSEVPNHPMAEVALAMPSVREAVGQDFNFISATDDEIVPGTEKGRAGNEASLVVFFSIDRNQTVNAYINGTELINLVIDQAEVQQPPLSDPEKDRAGELARAYWEAQGDSRIDQLEDFAILGVEADGSYYDNRVAYVSFHLDDTARPELLAWVDLTDEIVLDARADR